MLVLNINCENCAMYLRKMTLMKNSVAETTEQTTICKHTRIISLYNQNPLESSLSIQSQLNSTQTLLQIGGCSKSAAFTVCKKFYKSRTVKHLLWMGRPEKCTKIFERYATLPVLEPLMSVRNYAFISG